MNNDKKISIFFLVFVAFFVLCFFYASKNGLRGPIEDKEDDNIKITTKAIQTSEYYADLDQTKFIIDSKDELDVFLSKFKGDLKLDKTNFDKNKVFIQIEEVPSSGIKKELADVIVEDNIIFVIKTPPVDGAVTDDMALWYYVAIIPNSKLDGVDYTDYYRPSDIINIDNQEYDYIIETDNKYITMMDDGGSNTNIYYQIDSKNNIIIKNKEEFHANLGGEPETIKEKLYEKNISTEDLLKIEEIYANDNLEKTADMPFKINEKEIYDQNIINELKELLNKIDND